MRRLFDLAGSALGHGTYAIGVFAVVLALGLAVIASPLSIGLYLTASERSAWLASLGALLGFATGTVASFVLAVQLASLLTAERLVRSLGVGTRTLDYVFTQALDSPPGESPAPTSPMARLHGLPLPDVRVRVDSASRRVLEAGIAGRPPLRWFMGPLRRVLVWAMMRVIARNAACPNTSPPQIDINLLRTNLGSRFDDFVVGQLCASRARVVAFVLIPAIVVASILWATLRSVPAGGA